mgnify:CR=1 FL=1
MNKIVKVELIGDGSGDVLMFVNGFPFDNFYVEYSLTDKLEYDLKRLLCRYPPEENEEEEPEQ